MAVVDLESNINERIEPHGCTLLHFAACHGKLDICYLLIKRGADKESKDCKGSTPLHNAAEWGHLEVAEYLVSQGANVFAVNNHNQTPEEIAFYHGHIHIYTMLQQAKINNANSRERSFGTLSKKITKALKTMKRVISTSSVPSLQSLPSTFSVGSSNPQGSDSNIKKSTSDPEFKKKSRNRPRSSSF